MAEHDISEKKKKKIPLTYGPSHPLPLWGVINFHQMIVVRTKLGELEVEELPSASSSGLELLEHGPIEIALKSLNEQEKSRVITNTSIFAGAGPAGSTGSWYSEI